MKILITGASGQLGRALIREFGHAHELYLAVRSLEGDANLIQPKRGNYRKLDITNQDDITVVVKEAMPEVIINAAAFTAVDLCESKEQEAYEVNAAAVNLLAEAAFSCNAKFVQVSTDYVFSGDQKRPYKVEDSTNPLSVYGKTKLEGEHLARKNCYKTFVIRTAWLYGEGKNFVQTILRLAKTEETIKVVDDQFGSPTSAKVLAAMIHFLIKTDAYGDYHGVCSGAASRYEFAREIIEMAGLTANLIPVSTKDYTLPAVRPAYAVLDNTKLSHMGCVVPGWKDALKDYLK